jgi:hypothetical protein
MFRRIIAIGFLKFDFSVCEFIVIFVQYFELQIMRIYRMVLLIVAIALLGVNVYYIFTKPELNPHEFKTYLGIIMLLIIIPAIIWRNRQERNSGK